MMSNEKIIEEAKYVCYWSYIFGENNIAAKELLLELGGALQEAEYIFKKGGSDDTKRNP